MATPLIPFTLAWLIGIWLASRVTVPSLALGVAAIAALVGIIPTTGCGVCADRVAD